MHQPLAFHDKAMDAALAMQAAHRQGKAWQMHDKMFENNQALARDDLDRYAKEIGLDVARFKKDMDDPKLKEEVLADQKVANSVGASGTPTFFINGRKLVGAQPTEQFVQVIDEELKKADELLKKGTPADKLYEKLLEEK
jgi:predicted DsbA family dithiol-disulfide isomerase